MSGYHIRSGLISTLAVATIIASCGGSDDSGDNGAASDSAGTVAPTETAADDATTDATIVDETVDETMVDEATDETADASDGGSTTNCDAIFSMDEVEEFFGEPAELTEETNDDIGQLVCTWETIEDPDDLEDLAVQSLLVQFYSGSPINGTNFFDLDYYDSPTPIEGIGDTAYATGTEGMDYFFVDDPVSGSLNYIRFDLGSDEPQVERTQDDVEQLFRLFYDRVT
jgi:hypothetical protein